MEQFFSLCWPLILLHHSRNGFLAASTHGFPISAGFQPTLFTKTGRTGPFYPPFLQTGPGKLLIQTIASLPVEHNCGLGDCDSICLGSVSDDLEDCGGPQVKGKGES